MFHGVQGLHAAHRGSYSIERLKAFDEYCHRTSVLRALAVCLALPIPALAVAIGMECIPLQDPKAGWRANYGAFTRDGVMFFMTTFGLCLQTTQLIPNLSMTLFRMILVSIATALSSISLRMLVAELWVYPIPFGYAWGAGPDTVFMAVHFLVAVGRRQLREKPTLSHELWQQFVIMACQSTLCVIYPAYNIVYLKLNSDQQTVFVFVLPLIKFALQNVVVWSTKHIVEYMPGVTVLSLEVFNALYLAKCMQSQGSMAPFVAIIVFDALESVIAYRDMKTRSSHVYELMRKYNAVNVDQRGFVETVMTICQDDDLLSTKCSSIRIRSPLRLSLSKEGRILLKNLVRTQTAAQSVRGFSGKNTNESGNLVEQVKSLQVASIFPFSDTGTTTRRKFTLFKVKSTNFRNRRRFSIKVAPIPSKPQLTAAVISVSGDLLPGLCSYNDFGNTSSLQTGVVQQEAQLMGPVVPCKVAKMTDFHDQERRSHENILKFSQSKVLMNGFNMSPGYTDLLIPNTKTQNGEFTSSLTLEEKIEIVDQSLKLLFYCEYHVLVEYVEAMIPMLYCVYVSILTHLPSQIYYVELRGMSDAHLRTMIGNIFAYAWMELLSFIAMHFAIKRKFGFSPLYLLAFVLENQSIEFQARLLAWFSYVLEMTLVHFGVDLSMKLAWVHGDWSDM